MKNNNDKYVFIDANVKLAYLTTLKLEAIILPRLMVQQAMDLAHSGLDVEQPIQWIAANHGGLLGMVAYDVEVFIKTPIIELTSDIWPNAEPALVVKCGKIAWH